MIIGLAYMGEYPLSFAACLNEEACYHIVLAAGADPDNMDTNGNSVIHMMVIHNKRDMLDMAYENGASTTLRNRQGLTPLSLAAKLARKEIFFHLLAINCSIYWKVGSIIATATPLADLDTIQAKTGELATQAALSQIVFGKEENHLSLLDGVVLELLKVKWKFFVKRRFYTMFFVFLCYNILVTCYMLTEENIGLDLMEIEDQMNITERNIMNIDLTENLNSSLKMLLPSEKESSDIEIFLTVKVLLHFLIFLFSIGFHTEAAYENFYLGSKCFCRTLLLCPSRIIFLSRLANNFK